MKGQAVMLLLPAVSATSSEERDFDLCGILGANLISLLHFQRNDGARWASLWDALSRRRVVRAEALSRKDGHIGQ